MCKQNDMCNEENRESLKKKVRENIAIIILSEIIYYLSAQKLNK